MAFYRLSVVSEENEDEITNYCLHEIVARDNNKTVLSKKRNNSKCSF